MSHSCPPKRHNQPKDEGAAVGGCGVRGGIQHNISTSDQGEGLAHHHQVRDWWNDPERHRSGNIEHLEEHESLGNVRTEANKPYLGAWS